MARVGIIYYGKCNYYILIKCIRQCTRHFVSGEFIENYLTLLAFY